MNTSKRVEAVWLRRPRETKRRAYGGVLVAADGRVLLRSPSNHYGGYVWTLAKGGAKHGESPQQAALREVNEETGWAAEVTGELEGWFVGDTSDVKVFLMRGLRDRGRFDRETQEIRWVTVDEALELVAMSTTSVGRARDLAIFRAVGEHLAGAGLTAAQPN